MTERKDRLALADPGSSQCEARIEEYGRNNSTERGDARERDCTYPERAFDGAAIDHELKRQVQPLDVVSTRKWHGGTVAGYGRRCVQR